MGAAQAQTNGKVIPITRKASVSRVDWAKIDAIRQFVRRYVKTYGFWVNYRPLNIRSLYDVSTFYIGRHTMQVTFKRLYMVRQYMAPLADRLRSQFGVRVYVEDNDMYVYLRGKRR